MKKLYSLSSRTLIPPLILLVLFSLVFFVSATKWLQTREIAKAASRTASAADQILDDQIQLVSRLEQLVTTISFFPAIHTHTNTDLEHLLSILVAANASVANILVSDAGGTVWASALPSRTVLSVADKHYFRRAVASGMFSSGEFTVGGASATPLLSFAYPVKNSLGTVSDVIIVLVPVGINSKLYHDEHTGPISSVVLTDNKGIILYSSGKMGLTGKKDKTELFAKMSGQPDGGAFEAIGNLGNERYFSYRSLKLKHETVPCMFIRTGLNKEPVLRNSYMQAGYMTAASTLILTLLLYSGLYVRKKYIFDRLKVIQETADRIAHGDFSVRATDQVANPEMLGLARVIDELADNLSDKIRGLQYSENALKQSENNYSELVEKAQIIILRMDGSGRISFINEYALLYFGFSEQELLGQSVIGTIVPEVESSGRDLQEMMTRLAENPSQYASNINENMRKSGERVWISWSNHKLVDADGVYQGVLAVGQDISDLMHMEESLRISEQRFRSFVESASDVVFSLTASGTFSYVSPQWKEALGHELSEVVGKPFEVFVHPEDVAVCNAFLETVMETGKRHRGVEYRVQHKNGTWLWYTANGSRIIERDNSASFIGIGHDITERKRIQSELMKTERLESLGLLAAGIAHNFNNILTGVIGYISFARKHLTDYEKTAPLLEAAEKSSHRAASLARQLLTFSRAGVPLRKLESADNIVQESLASILSSSGITGIVYDRSTLAVKVDREQMKQAFNSIVLNSILSMPDGGGLTVHIDDLLFETENVYLLKPGSYVKILFEDSGCGIEKEHLKKVFDPYFTTRADGSGLGLSTAHSIITKHDGYIGIASEINHGTTVTIILPGFSRISPMNPSKQLKQLKQPVTLPEILR